MCKHIYISYIYIERDTYCCIILSTGFSDGSNVSTDIWRSVSIDWRVLLRCQDTPWARSFSLLLSTRYLPWLWPEMMDKPNFDVHCSTENDDKSLEVALSDYLDKPTLGGKLKLVRCRQLFPSFSGLKEDCCDMLKPTTSSMNDYAHFQDITLRIPGSCTRGTTLPVADEQYQTKSNLKSSEWHVQWIPLITFISSGKEGFGVQNPQYYHTPKLCKNLHRIWYNIVRYKINWYIYILIYIAFFEIQ